MSTTKLWAESLKVASDADLTPLAEYSETYARSAREVAIRAVILQGVAAIAYKVEAQPIIEWFQTQGIWSDVTPQERIFILGSAHTEAEQVRFRWKQEAQWTLLWMIHRVESLGLPTGWEDVRHRRVGVRRLDHPSRYNDGVDCSSVQGGAGVVQ